MESEEGSGWWGWVKETGAAAAQALKEVTYHYRVVKAKMPLTPRGVLTLTHVQMLQDFGEVVTVVSTDTSEAAAIAAETVVEKVAHISQQLCHLAKYESESCSGDRSSWNSNDPSRWNRRCGCCSSTASRARQVHDFMSSVTQLHAASVLSNCIGDERRVHDLMMVHGFLGHRLHTPIIGFMGFMGLISSCTFFSSWASHHLKGFIDVMQISVNVAAAAGVSATPRRKDIHNRSSSEC